MNISKYMKRGIYIQYYMQYMTLDIQYATIHNILIIHTVI